VLPVGTTDTSEKPLNSWRLRGFVVLAICIALAQVQPSRRPAAHPVVSAPEFATSIAIAPKLVLAPLTDESLDQRVAQTKRVAPPLSVLIARLERERLPRLSTHMDCLARSIYFEARGEAIAGQLAVAQVVLNRLSDPRYPKTICDVVYEHRSTGMACQFTFTCDAWSDTPTDGVAWRRAKAIALVAHAQAWRDITGGQATHYHADYVSPEWAALIPETRQIGRHIFYREAL
jgi:Cell Wall Hydrolase